MISWEEKFGAFSMSEKPVGLYKLKWNGINNSGQNVSSGIYILRMTAGKFSKSYKLMLMK